MHDRNGTELHVGDTVMVEAVITELWAGDEFCNVAMQSVAGRRPDGAKESLGAINTGVVTLLSRAPEPQADPVIQGDDHAS